MRSYAAASPSKRIAARASLAEAEAAAATTTSSSSSSGPTDGSTTNNNSSQHSTTSGVPSVNDDDDNVADYLAALSPGSPEKRDRRGNGQGNNSTNNVLLLPHNSP
jgi:hypothetical protein